MNNYKKINNIFGWVAFAAAFIVYALTMEPTASFWDCGEFISASYGLQVVHPPGAPLFLIIGRFFSLFAGDNLQMVAPMVNMVSVLSSAFCVMFTFWITTYFARKLVLKTVDNPGQPQLIGIMGAGLVAALTLTFSDTFWFSAVEAEVYAASSFFTAITFWAILKWEEHADERHSDKWLVFIGYLIGLAIGVHLLNLLVIPAVVFVYYFRRYQGRISRNGIILAGCLAAVILVGVQVGIIPGIPTMAAHFDRFFVNSLNASFGIGAVFFMAILIGATVFGIIWSKKNGKINLNTALVCFSFILIGYSSYTMVLIRSNANPPIDMNNPDDPYNLVYYLNREQYGDRPLLFGPYFTSRPVDAEPKYQYLRKGGEYVKVRSSYTYEYDDKDKIFFPRIYDFMDPSHEQGYRLWTDLSQDKKPKYKHNIRFFTRYQLGWMYWRYFMWNFSGRQNDEQGFIGPVNGNWLSGINFIDEARLGPQDNLPEYQKENRGRNVYFMLPFILGLIGLFYHIRKDKENSFILGVLFLITGIVLIVYLNPPPFEPRERDYVFVGSFQVFCTWVGLAVLAMANWFSRKMAATVAVTAATGIALVAAPALMASQNWDDHDRSGRYMTIDFARNYLESCPKNAILFTNGDNDTYPLWYAQNVEKVRTDVRVVNFSLLNAAEYADQLRQAAYESAPIKLSFTPEQYMTGTRDFIKMGSNQRFRPNQFYDLRDIMKFIASENEADKLFDPQEKESVSYLPTKKIKLVPDLNKWAANGWVNPNDTTLLREMTFDLPGNGLYRNSMILLDIIANNMNERPICFTTTTGSDVYLGMTDFFELRGLIYRIVPYRTPSPGQNIYGRVNTDTLYKLLMKDYKWGGIEEKDMYVDDKAKLVPQNMRNHYYRLAGEFYDKGDKAKCIEVLDHCLKVLPEKNLPYTDNMVYYAELYYRAGAKDKAEALLDRLAKSAGERVKYYSQYRGRELQQASYPRLMDEKQYAQALVNKCVELANTYGSPEKAKQWQVYMN